MYQIIFYYIMLKVCIISKIYLTHDKIASIKFLPGKTFDESEYYRLIEDILCAKLLISLLVTLNRFTPFIGKI